MRTRFVLPLLLVFALSSGSAHADICNSLFAAKIKQRGGLADCDQDQLTQNVGPDCMWGQFAETANQCAKRVYDTAEMLALLAGPGNLYGNWLPKCRNGTNSCPAPELRCYDGTRPMIYADNAAAPSNDWVFVMGGEGGPCHGDACWAMYNGGHGSEHLRAMSTRHPDYPPTTLVRHRQGHGVLSDDIGNPFVNFNRIKFKRCSDGASATYEVIRTPHGDAPVFHDGSAMWEGMVNFLRTAQGLDPNDPTDDLPSLANADHVLLAATSDAVQWLVVNADRVRALFQFVAPQADVRIVVDGFFAPMLENEARYNGNPFNNLFDGPFGNPIGAQLPPGRAPTPVEAPTDGEPTYGDEIYRPGGAIREDWDARGVELDRTCLNAHLDKEPCYDHHHVLLNHLSTPFFIIADSRDRTIRKHLSLYARQGVHAEGVYRWAKVPYRIRVMDQGWDVDGKWALASEMAAGGEDDDADAFPWSPGLFLLRPNVEGHTHLGDDAKFFDGLPFKMMECDGQNPLGPPLSMGQALYDWLISNTAIAAIEDWRVGNQGAYWLTFPRSCGDSPL